MELNTTWLGRAIEMALEEDVGLGDVTTQATVPVDAEGTGRMWAKEPGVIAGLEVAAAVFEWLSPEVEFIPLVEEGASVEAGDSLATIEGDLRAILTGERTALNFIQRLSGVATQTSGLVTAIAGTGVQVIDTRKTTPGLRMLEKYAVSLGGGANHRWALDSGVLIKDNHIIAAGGVTQALEAARATAPHSLSLEIECKELIQVQEAIDAGADIVMLDNMRGDILREALKTVNGQCKVEVSGGITLENIREVALPGVNWISVGALTHSVKAIDISLDISEVSS